MRRLLIFALILTVSLGIAREVSASTDCSQWIAEYRQKLEDSQRVHKLLQASHRVHTYLKHKVTTRPKVGPTLVKTGVQLRFRRPKMTSVEMLKRFSIVCGDLTEEQPTSPLLPLLEPVSFTLAQPTFSPPEDLTSPVPSGLPLPPALLSSSPPGDSPMPPILSSGLPPGEPGNPTTVPPVPEPSTLLLVGSGASALIGRVIRSRRSTRSRCS